MAPWYKDALAAPLWLGLNGLLGLVSWAMSQRIFPKDEVVQRTIHSIILSWTVIVASAIVLGAVGLLKASTLFVSVAVILLGAVVFLVKTRGHARPAASILHTDSNQRVSTRIAWILSTAFLVSFGVLWSVMQGVLTFPHDYDSLWYHIPMVDQWLQAGSLYAPDCSHWYNPGTSEILCLWLCAPFSGDFLIGINNLLPVGLLVLAACEMGRLAALPRFLSLAAALAMVNTVMFAQMTDASNDVAVVALFLASMVYGIRFAHNAQNANLALATMSIGLLAGVKYFALGYAAVAWLAITVFTQRIWGKKLAVKAATITALGSALLGGYWYVRNALVSGSPLYPLGLTEATDELARVYPEVWQSSFWGNGRPELLELGIQAAWKKAGPVGAVAVVALPLTLAWVLVQGILGVRRRAWPGPGGVQVVIGVSTLAAGFILLNTPYAVEDVPGTLNHLIWAYTPVRYGTCFLSLAILCLVITLYGLFNVFWTIAERVLWLGNIDQGNVVFSALRTGSSHFTALILVATAAYHVAFQEIAVENDKLIDAGFFAVDLVLLSTITYVIWSLTGRYRSALAFLMPFVVLVGATSGAFYLSSHWHSAFGRFYSRSSTDSLFLKMESLVPPGSRICVLFNRSYPFFGSQRQYRVCQPSRVPSKAWLANYLRSKQIDFVAIKPSEPGQGVDPSCPDWLEANPRAFHLISPESRRYALYRVDSIGLNSVPPDTSAKGWQRVAQPEGFSENR